MNHVQSWKRYRLFGGVSNKMIANLLLDLVAQFTHRSNSAAIMLMLPSTATTSLNMHPRIILGNNAKCSKEGGRVRAR
jgi:hypothetical protein